MKINLVSDLHLEFGALEKPLPEGDVLLLAGDTTVVACLAPHRQDARSRSVKKATQRLNAEISRKFKRAYAVIGNHEPYGSFYHEAKDALADALPAVTILDCDYVKLSENVLLFAAPFWTDMGGGNPLTALAIRNGMTDFNPAPHNAGAVIRARDGSPFTPEQAATEHHKAIACLGKLAEENRGKTIVVMSHHAPSRHGCGDHTPNALDHAYYTDLGNFISCHPNIRYWCFGHTHVRKKFEIAQCKVFSNARGYYRHEYMERSFDPDMSFEVEHWLEPATELEPLDNDF